MKMTFLMVAALFFLSLPAGAVEPVDLLAAVNAERSKVGMNLLEQNEALDAMAQQWAQEAAKKKSLSHRKDLTQLMRAQGWTLLNENIYMGSGKVDAARVVRAWMKSPGHQRNLMNISLNRAGFGSASNADGETYVVFNGGLR